MSDAGEGLAAAGVDRVAGLDRDLARTLGAGGGEPGADAGLVQALVV